MIVSVHFNDVWNHDCRDIALSLITEAFLNMHEVIQMTVTYWSVAKQIGKMTWTNSDSVSNFSHVLQFSLLEYSKVFTIIVMKNFFRFAPANLQLCVAGDQNVTVFFENSVLVWGGTIVDETVLSLQILHSIVMKSFRHNNRVPALLSSVALWAYMY